MYIFCGRVCVHAQHGRFSTIKATQRSCLSPCQTNFYFWNMCVKDPGRDLWHFMGVKAVHRKLFSMANCAFQPVTSEREGGTAKGVSAARVRLKIMISLSLCVCKCMCVIVHVCVCVLVSRRFKCITLDDSLYHRSAGYNSTGNYHGITSQEDQDEERSEI